MDNPVLQITFDFLHLMATITWIGGMFYNFLVLLPSVNSTLDAKTAGILMKSVFKRVRIIVYVSLLVLFVTGIPMKISSEYYVSIINFDTSWEIVLFIKHVFVALMALLAIINFEIIVPKVGKLAMEGERSLSKLKALKKKQFLLSGLAFITGIIVVFLSSVMNYI